MKKERPTVSIIYILLGIFVSLILINIFLLYLTSNQTKTIKQLQNEMVSLNQQKQAALASQDILEQYKGEINTLTSVFPSEETMPNFIKSLESIIRSETDEYSFRFSSITPIKEKDKLYLLLTITLKINISRLPYFLSLVEDMPYMNHITSMTYKYPVVEGEKGEARLSLKVYVQNPFTSK